jgi:hypothetical protein
LTASFPPRGPHRGYVIGDGADVRAENNGGWYRCCHRFSVDRFGGWRYSRQASRLLNADWVDLIERWPV